jgi:hypothetical protein
MIEPLAETLEPRGESGIVGQPRPMFPVLARVVAHALDTRKTQGNTGFPRYPEAARTILTGSGSVKNRAPWLKVLESNEQLPLRGGLSPRPRAALRVPCGDHEGR